MYGSARSDFDVILLADSFLNVPLLFLGKGVFLYLSLLFFLFEMLLRGHDHELLVDGVLHFSNVHLTSWFDHGHGQGFDNLSDNLILSIGSDCHLLVLLALYCLMKLSFDCFSSLHLLHLERLLLGEVSFGFLNS